MSGMDIPALMDKAHHLMKVGRYDEAISLYDQVLEVNGNNTKALENKGKIYYYLGRHEDEQQKTEEFENQHGRRPSGGKTRF
mgnify:CR=1 FL=1